MGLIIIENDSQNDIISCAVRRWWYFLIPCIYSSQGAALLFGYIRVPPYEIIPGSPKHTAMIERKYRHDIKPPV